MKLVFQAERWKRYQQKRARKVLKRRVKLHRRVHFKAPPIVDSKPRPPRYFIRRKGYQHLRRRGKKHIKLTAPHIFSVIENADKVLAYFEVLRKYLSRGKTILIDIANVVKMTPETLALLTAKVSDERFLSKGVIYGNEPKDNGIKKLLSESGFFDHVILLKNEKRTPSSSHLIHVQTDNRAESEYARTVCECASMHTFGEISPPFPLYEILIECMSNTKNHAAGSRIAIYDWWVFAYTEKATGNTHVTFLDLGIGVFRSNPVVKYKKMFKFAGSNARLVKQLFEGEIRSRTGRKDRGKGMPQIKSLAQDTIFSKFMLLSNDILTDLKTEETKTLNRSFSGTLYYIIIEKSKEERHGTY